MWGDWQGWLSLSPAAWSKHRTPWTLLNQSGASEIVLQPCIRTLALHCTWEEPCWRRKLRTQCSRLLVCVSIQHLSRCLIATSTLKFSFWHLQDIHVHVRKKSGRFYIDLSVKEESKMYILHGHFLEIEVCKSNVRSGFRLHSRISRSEASFILFFNKSARKLVVEPPMTVDLSLFVVAVTLAPCCLTSPFSHRVNMFLAFVFL